MGSKDQIEPGDRFANANTRMAVRVLAVGYGYAMVRYPRAMPFAISCTELLKWQRVKPARPV
jgi:hypothetical protein